MSYSNLLKDPKWQRKRLEIFERDRFCCRKCGSNEYTLHVHHLYYESGKKPWEYRDEALWTLCEYCHAEETLLKDEPQNFLRLWQEGGIDNTTFSHLTYLLEQLYLSGFTYKDVYQLIRILNEYIDFQEVVRSMIIQVLEQERRAGSGELLDDLPF